VEQKQIQFLERLKKSTTFQFLVHDIQSCNFFLGKNSQLQKDISYILYVNLSNQGWYLSVLSRFNGKFLSFSLFYKHSDGVWMCCVSFLGKLFAARAYTDYFNLKIVVLFNF